MMNFWITKTELPPDVGATILWRPSFVFFQADWSAKGLAFFTSFANADGYRLLLEENTSFPVTVEVFDAEQIPAYAACVTEHIRSANKAYRETVVYLDPPNLFCKGIKVSFNSFEKFLFKHFQSSVPWAHEVIGFSHESGFTIELLKSKLDGKFIALCMKGIFKDRESISTAIQDALGTTDEVYHKRSDACAKPEDALAVVAEHVQRLATK